MKRAKFFHREVQQKVDNVLNAIPHKELIQCRKGCSACCHTQVSATQDEVDLLVRKISREKIKIDKVKLAMQARFSDSYEQWMRMPYEMRGCVFLNSDGNCKVYDDRPSVCRTNYALSNPLQCETRDGQTYEQRLLLTIEADLVVALVFEMSEKSGSLPSLLQESLKSEIDLFRL